MSLSTGEKILASDFAALRTRVLNECSRRGLSASINNVTAEKLIEASDLNTLIAPLKTINSTKATTANVAKGDLIKSISGVANNITYFESCAKVGTNSGCASGCMGLCQGCSGTCQGSCTGSCETSCTGGCKGSCTSCSGCSSCTGCSGSCTNFCSQGCTSCTGCGYNCTTSCENSCSGCTGCSGGCTGNCSSCTGSCSGSCSGTSIAH